MWMMIHTMATIQIVIGEKLLRATDDAATAAGVNRSALIRKALRMFLHERRVSDLERRDREGYARIPEDQEALAVWEDVAEWPDE